MLNCGLMYDECENKNNYLNLNFYNNYLFDSYTLNSNDNHWGELPLWETENNGTNSFLLDQNFLKEQVINENNVTEFYSSSDNSFTKNNRSDKQLKYFKIIHDKFFSYSSKDKNTESSCKISPISKDKFIYTCDADGCNKVLSTKWGLIQHKKIFCGKSYLLNCDLCNNKYKTNEALKRHRNAVHDQKKLFSCQFCDKRFFHRNSNLIHQRKHHKDKLPFKCTYLSNIFINARL